MLGKKRNANMTTQVLSQEAVQVAPDQNTAEIDQLRSIIDEESYCNTDTVQK